MEKGKVMHEIEKAFAEREFEKKDIVEQMKKYKRLFLIDGDSFIYKALNGMNRIDPEDKILILVSDEALRSKLIQKGYVRQNVGVIVVMPGNEAVDNRIKGILGNLIKRENRGRIFIISHDHGYYKHSSIEIR